MKTTLIWIIGFVVLFAFNAAVELIALPLLDLENTEKNDIYFMSWWLLVGAWFLFGWQTIERLARREETEAV